MNTAVSKATELGCDVLVHQALYEGRQGWRGSHPNGVASWLFTCGVFDAAKQTEETARLADATAWEIVRREYGEPVCANQFPTGSQMVRYICRLPGAYFVWSDGTSARTSPQHWFSSDPPD